MIAAYESNLVLNNAVFLLKKGYTVAINDNMIVYSNPENQIIITFEPYSDVSDMNIKFIEKNEVFSIGWIAFVQKSLKSNPHERLENVLKLLRYVEENYDDITKYNYCVESNKLIDEFINNNRK